MRRPASQTDSPYAARQVLSASWSGPKLWTDQARKTETNGNVGQIETPNTGKTMSDGAVERIEKSLLEDGFLYEVRTMNFDAFKAKRLIETLREIENGDISSEDEMEIVSRIWQLPHLFLAYRERCVTNGANLRLYNSFLHDLRRVVGGVIDKITREHRNASGHS